MLDGSRITAQPIISSAVNWTEHGVNRVFFRQPLTAFYIYLPLQALLCEIMPLGEILSGLAGHWS